MSDRSLDDEFEFKIAKLDMAASDILVVRVKRPIAAVAAAELRARMERHLGRKVLILDPDMELSVIAKKDAKKLAASGAMDVIDRRAMHPA